MTSAETQIPSRPDPYKKIFRIDAFDGLRGVAALAVAVYHYACLAHPTWTANMAPSQQVWVDTPIYLLINGPFAVALFFVLSGYVMAAAAERRASSFFSSSAARYLRLTVPAVASCIFAWTLLQGLPEAANRLASSLENPSRWLEFTYQREIPSLFLASLDGSVGVYWRGYSRFNNVLWTMQIELFGSLAVYALYTFSTGRVRLCLLIVGTLVLPLLTEPSYLAFGLGALLFENHRTGFLDRFVEPLLTRILILIVAILLSFPGEGYHFRQGLPDVAEPWRLGEHRGYMHVLGATLFILATLYIRTLKAFFSQRLPLWLGRLSFSLYLIHVPILYTVVAFAYSDLIINKIIVFTGYLSLILVVSTIFERGIDRPLLKTLPIVRKEIDKRFRLERKDVRC